MASLTLYSRPVRRYLVIVLSLLVLWHSLLVILSTGAALAVYGIQQAVSADQSLAAIVLLLCRCIVPIGLWVNSINELYTLFQRTLTPLRVVLIASVSIVLLFAGIGYWAACVPATVLANPEYLEHPFFSPASESAIPGNTGLKKYSCNVLPWVITPGLLL